MTAAVAVLMASVATFTACNKDDDDKKENNTEQKQQDSGEEQGGGEGKGSGLEMVTVEGGTFTMGATSEQGSDAFNNETPIHSVTLSSYQIGKYEVTQKLWKEIMGTNPSFDIGDDKPVNCISLEEIEEFITKLYAKTGKTYRLPTEAEWEYAARGGNQSKGYKYSGSNNIDDVAWYSGNSRGDLHPVGQKSPNELGIYDMSGNVIEWCSDFYDYYPSSPQTNPWGCPVFPYPVRNVRGGTYFDDARYCRVSSRYSYGGDSYSTIDLGFRLAMDAE